MGRLQLEIPRHALRAVQPSAPDCDDRGELRSCQPLHAGAGVAGDRQGPAAARALPAARTVPRRRGQESCPSVARTYRGDAEDAAIGAAPGIARCWRRGLIATEIFEMNKRWPCDQATGECV